MKKEDEEYSYLERLGYNITLNQFKNLLAFLTIILNEEVIVLVDRSPDYILEKFYRYVGSDFGIRDSNDHLWGVHLVLYEQFILKYHDRWGKVLGWPISDFLKVL